MRPVVSVIIPTCNRPQMVSEAIASATEVCASVLSRDDFEVVVVDDGRVLDATRTISEQAGARYVRGGGLGVSAARNAGVRNALGEFVAFLDDDDIWLPEHLAEHLHILRTDRQIGFVFSQGVLADAELRPVTGPSPVGVPTTDVTGFLLRNCPHFDTMVVRRSLFLDVGGFDPSLDSSEDHDLALRLAAAAPGCGLNVPSALYRQHGPPQSAARLRARRKQGFQVLRKHWRASKARFWRVQAETALLPLRGWYAYHFVRSAGEWSDSNNRVEALKCLAGSVASSPLHAFRMGAFWSALLNVGLARGGVGRKGVGTES